VVTLATELSKSRTSNELAMHFELDRFLLSGEESGYHDIIEHDFYSLLTHGSCNPPCSVLFLSVCSERIWKILPEMDDLE